MFLSPLQGAVPPQRNGGFKLRTYTEEIRRTTESTEEHRVEDLGTGFEFVRKFLRNIVLVAQTNFSCKINTGRDDFFPLLLSHF